MTGNKEKLLEKIADGKIFGQIPRCPSCFGGRPKFDYMTSTYTCTGYRDDEDKVECDKNYNMDEIEREPWID